MKVREVLELLEVDGWFLITQKGSHRQLKHPTKPGRVTIAGKLSHDVPKGTPGSILRQAQLKERGPR